MARIELRNATIRLVDGYSNTAAVNDTPAADDTTLTIDTVLGVDASGDGSNPANKIIPLSTRFTVVGSTEKYTVTDQDANAQLDIDLDVGTGNFTITIDGEVSANIAHDALVATIQAAVDAITGVTAGDFLVTKPTASTVTVKALADGAFEDTAVTMSADLGSLTGALPRKFKRMRVLKLTTSPSHRLWQLLMACRLMMLSSPLLDELCRSRSAKGISTSRKIVNSSTILIVDFSILSVRVTMFRWTSPSTSFGKNSLQSPELPLRRREKFSAVRVLLPDGSRVPTTLANRSQLMLNSNTFLRAV